jgi:hypothetical protein
MRQWLRSRLTYANVTATLALFLVLGGGSAVALSGSNTVFTDDVANDTHPASGGNPAGGLVAADLRPSSVGTSEVALNSLSGTDVNESGLGIVPNANQLDGIDSSGFLTSGSAKQLRYQTTVGTGASDTTDLATVGPYTIKGRCQDDGSGIITDLFLRVNGPAGTAYVMRHDTSVFGGATTTTVTDFEGPVSIPASTDTTLTGDLTAAGGNTKRNAGTAMLTTGSAVVQVDFHAFATGSGGDECRIYGTATMGT